MRHASTDRPAWLTRVPALALSALLAGALVAPAIPAYADPESPGDGESVFTAQVTASSAGVAPVGRGANVWGTVSGLAGAASVSAQMFVGSAWVTQQTVQGITGPYVLPLDQRTPTAGTHRWRVVATDGTTTVTSAEFQFRRYDVNVSTAGTKYVGQATNAWGSVAGFNSPVTITIQALVGGKWSTSQVARGVTGGWQLPLTYGANQAGTHRFRVVASNGTDTTVKEFSLVRRALPVVTVSSAGSKVVDAETFAWGSVAGFSGPATVSTQVLVNGRWATSQSVSGVTGSYKLPLTYGANVPGTYTFRVVASRSGEPTAVSKSFAFTRTAKPIAGLDSRCLTGRAMCISKAQRKLYWVVNGSVQMSFDVRFGSELTPTRNGAFQVNWKSRNHVSSLYHTSMPYAMFFSGGQAVHYSPDFAANGYNGASHGCVNVRDKAKIAQLFDIARVGDKVIVYTG